MYNMPVKESIWARSMLSSDSENFCLKWNDFIANITDSYKGHLLSSRVVVSFPPHFVIGPLIAITITIIDSEIILMKNALVVER